MGNPPEWRQNYVSKPVTSNVIGYIWEIRAISTSYLYKHKLSNIDFDIVGLVV